MAVAVLGSVTSNRDGGSGFFLLGPMALPGWAGVSVFLAGARKVFSHQRPEANEQHKRARLATAWGAGLVGAACPAKGPARKAGEADILVPPRCSQSRTAGTPQPWCPAVVVRT